MGEKTHFVLYFSAKKFIQGIADFVRDRRDHEEFERFELMVKYTPEFCPTWRKKENFELVKRLKIFSYKHVNYQRERDFLAVLSLRKQYLY